jgi:hypothetical protein
MTRTSARFAVALGLIVGSACNSGHSESVADQKPLREASGLAHDGQHFWIAGDDISDAYYVYDLQPSDLPQGTGPILSKITVDTAHVRRFPLTSDLAIDLEGVALVSENQPLLLSERLRALILPPNHVIAEFSDQLAETGGRGLEGVAIRRISDSQAAIAVLWEGGLVEINRISRSLPEKGELATHVFKPLVCVDTVALPITVTTVKREPCKKDGLIELQVPVAAGDTSQHFRAPDLVWLPDGNSFLVLLSSQNWVPRGATPAYKYKWLQRFDLSGKPIGTPLNLCSILPYPVRDSLSGNVEGMTWYEEGKSVALVNDYKWPATIVIVAIPLPWPPTSDDVCR